MSPMKKYFFLTCFTAVFVLVGASNSFAQAKAKVQIKKTIDGKVEEETREIELTGGEDIDSILEQLGVVDDIGLLKPGQQFEIKIDKTTSDGGEENFKLSFSPESPKNSWTVFAPPSASTSSAFLGVMLIDDQNSETGEKGVWISDVVEGSPAEQVGLMTGDKILELNGTEVESSLDVIAIVKAKAPGDKIEVKYKRADKIKKVKVKLASKMIEGAASPGEFPDNEQWAAPPMNFEDFQFYFDGDSITIRCPDKPACICPTDSMRICQPFNWQADGMEMEEQAFLGVSPIGEQTDRGVAVRVDPATAAEKMGLRSNDVILAIDGELIHSFEALADAIAAKEPEQYVVIDALREGREIQLKGNLGKRTISQYDDFRIFHDFKGQDEQGLYNYDFEFDMDKEDLQRHMEEMLKELDLRQLEIDGEREGLLEELQRLQQPDEQILISIRIAEVSNADLNSVNQNATTKLKSTNDLAIEQISFFPNPNDGLLNLNFTTTDKAPVQIHIYDMQGQMVYMEELNQFNGSYKNQIDISKQPVGSYFLQIVQGSKSYSKKITKAN